MSKHNVRRLENSSESRAILEQLEFDIDALENHQPYSGAAYLLFDSEKQIIEYDHAAATILGIREENPSPLSSCSVLSSDNFSKLKKHLDLLLKSAGDEAETFLRFEIEYEGSTGVFCLTLQRRESDKREKEIFCKIEPILSQAPKHQVPNRIRENSQGLEFWHMDSKELCFKSISQLQQNSVDELENPEIPLDDWLNRICEYDKESFRDGFLKLLNSETEIFHMRYRIKTNSAELKWVSTIARRNLDEKSSNGKVSFVGLHRDEMEIPNIVDDLRLFSYLAKKAQLAILVTDSNGLVTWSNNAFTSISGYQLDEILEKTPASILQGPLSDPETIKHMEERVRRGKAFHAELINYKKNGAPFWNRIDANPLVDENGKLIRYIAFLTDITETKKNQGAILRSEIKFRSMFDNSVDALLLVSPKDGIIIEANNAAMAFFESTRLVGQKLDTIYPNSEVFDIDQLNRMVEDPNGGKRETGEFIRTDGRRQPIEMSVNCTPIGEAIALFVTLRDISEKRQLEEQLRHAQRMEAVGRLAGGIAHDFNNLLAGLRGFSELLCNSRDLTKKDHIYAHEVLKITDRASKLTNRLLSFSRGKSDKPVVTNLNEIVGNLTPMLSRILKKDIDFTSRLDPNLRNVKVDPSQIDQVVMNLVVNGQEAITNSQGLLTLNTKLVKLTGKEIFVTGKPTPGEYASVTVQDNGPGIPKNVLEKIFEPFFTTKKGAGTGLGLSIVYGIIINNGGHLLVESSSEKGSRFSFFFPTVSESVAQIESTEHTFDLPIFAPTNKVSKTILIAEDQDQVREILELGLSQCGYELIVANDGTQAIEIAKNYPNQIDMLLTDSIMPKASGTEVINEVRKKYPNIKVIMMSGLPQSDSEDSDTPHVDAFVDKPFSIRKLIDLIETFMQAHDSSSL